MSVNEMSLNFSHESSATTNRVLGILAIIGAPMMLLQFLFGSREMITEGANPGAFVALLGVFYIGGWIFSAIGMFRRKIYGDGLKRKIIFTVQIVFLLLAFMFSVQDIFGINHENGGVFFAICDAGYPLSHLFMIVVGFFTIRARIWQGFSRFAPLLVGVSLPVTLIFSAVVGMYAAVYLFGILTAIGLGAIGWKIVKE